MYQGHTSFKLEGVNNKPPLGCGDKPDQLKALIKQQRKGNVSHRTHEVGELLSEQGVGNWE